MPLGFRVCGVIMSVKSHRGENYELFYYIVLTIKL